VFCMACHMSSLRVWWIDDGEFIYIYHSYRSEKTMTAGAGVIGMASWRIHRDACQEHVHRHLDAAIPVERLLCGVPERPSWRRQI
jgi:hypothetical protein